MGGLRDAFYLTFPLMALQVCGPDVEKSVAAFKEALAAQRNMLVIASNSRQPVDANLQKVRHLSTRLGCRLRSGDLA